MAQYADLGYRELRALAKDRGLKFRGTPTKETVLDRLRQDDAEAVPAEAGPLTAESIPESVAESVEPENPEEENPRVSEVGHDEYIGDGPKRYRVQLRHLRPLVVAADSEVEAWDIYRDHCGVLATDHRPDIVEV